MLVVRDLSDERLYAEVYPVAGNGSVYLFHYPDGERTSLIRNDNKGWNPETLEVIEAGSGLRTDFDFMPITGAFRFPILEGVNYRLIGGA